MPLKDLGIPTVPMKVILARFWLNFSIKVNSSLAVWKNTSGFAYSLPGRPRDNNNNQPPSYPIKTTLQCFVYSTTEKNTELSFIGRNSIGIVSHTQRK